MLFDPARHEPLQAPEWNETRVRQFITRIVSQTEAQMNAHGLWPAHPNDGGEEDNPRAALPGRSAISKPSVRSNSSAIRWHMLRLYAC